MFAGRCAGIVWIRGGQKMIMVLVSIINLIALGVSSFSLGMSIAMWLFTSSPTKKLKKKEKGKTK